ncbi:MAG: hypothetical protein V3S01_05975, partial [Dehalococcoidia bacterium]
HATGKYGTGHTILKVCLWYRGVTIPWGSWLGTAVALPNGAPRGVTNGGDVGGPKGFEMLFPDGLAVGVVETVECNGLAYMRIAPAHVGAVMQTLDQALASDDLCRAMPREVPWCQPGRDAKLSSLYCMIPPDFPAEFLKAGLAQPVKAVLAKLRAEGRACVFVVSAALGTCIAGVPATGLPDIAAQGPKAIVLSEPPGGWQPACAGVTPPGLTPPTPQGEMTTGAKVVLGGLGLGAVALVIFIATKKNRR